MLGIAAEHGSLEICSFLLDARADINRHELRMHSVLSVAARSGHADVVALLVRQPSAFASDEYALVDAANARIVELLLATPLRDNAFNLTLCLNRRCEVRDLDSVKLLLATGAEPRLLLPSFPKPQACLAVVQTLVTANVSISQVVDDDVWANLGGANHHRIARVLLEANADPNEPDGAPLRHAALQHRPELLTLLLEAKADPNRTPETLASAVYRESTERVKLLLAHNADPNVPHIDEFTKKSTPLLHVAAGAGRDDIVAALLDANADPCPENSSAPPVLVVAATRGHVPTLRALVAAKAHADPDCAHEALKAACSYRHRDAAQLLLELCTGDLTNMMSKLAVLGHLPLVERVLAQSDPAGPTYTRHVECALVDAAAANALAVVAHLLKLIDKPHDHKAVLMATRHAAARGHSAMVRALLPHWSTMTPQLMCSASACCDAETVQLLLQRSADIDGVYGDDAPLFAAVMRNNVAVAELLLASGANCAVWRRCSLRSKAMRQPAVRHLFECKQCRFNLDHCCRECRKRFCTSKRCANTKSGKIAICLLFSLTRGCTEPGCVAHWTVACQSVLEWTLAMASLALPVYVLEEIFLASSRINGIAIAPNAPRVNIEYTHQLISERTHRVNIQLFINVQRAYQQIKK